MKLEKGLRAIIITVICFSIYMFSKEYFREIKTALDKVTHFGLLSYLLTYMILGIPLFVGTYLIDPARNIYKSLGLNHNLLRAFGYGLLFALPMLLGGLLFFDFTSEFNVQNIIAGSLIIGFVEELFFRGFLFGQIYNNSRWGFIPVIVLGAIVFASGHLYQSQDPGELIGIFGVTFMGAVLFAWLFVEWNDNLWVPIFLHAFMNLTWHIFEMDDTALGGILPNVLRALTVALAIVFTIVYKKRKGQELLVNRSTLIWRNGDKGKG
ncbi:MAG: CPBP family intramembrane metalloprotease [Bacteroidetes bacterium]|nr:MAG: CPBP family intramembrane metalloprotease [Bacteroidota bacterium]